MAAGTDTQEGASMYFAFDEEGSREVIGQGSLFGEDPWSAAVSPPVKDTTTAFDSERDPVGTQAATQAILKADSAQDDIAMKMPPDGAVTLQAGYVDPESNLHTDVEVRELTGRDEEVMAKAAATGDLTRYIDAVINCGVVRLGTIEDRQKIRTALDTLLVGDRDQIMLGIRVASYGKTSELEVVCPHCQDKFTINYDYTKDVPVKSFAPTNMESPEQRIFAVTTPSGSSVKIRFIDGRAQKLVWGTDSSTDKTDAERNSLMLKELISEYDGVPVKGMKPILEMVSRDRHFLLDWLNQGDCGPQFRDVAQECPTCLKEFPLVMTAGDMFRGE